MTFARSSDGAGRKDNGSGNFFEKNMLANFFSQASEAIIVVDQESVVLEWNRAAETITGISREQALGSFFPDIQYRAFTDEKKAVTDPQQFKARLASLIRAGDPELFNRMVEGIIQRPDGEVRHFQQVMFPVETEKGRLICGIFHDVTASKIAEAALRESEEKFRILAESIQLAILIYRESGIIYCNPAGLVMSGYSAEELLHMNALDVVFPDDREFVRQNMECRLRGDTLIPPYEVRMLSRSREIKWVEVSGGQINYHGIPAAILTIMEVTSRRNMEILNRALYEISELAQTVANLDELFRAIHRIINQLIRAENIYIALYDKEKDEISFPYFIDRNDPVPAPRKSGKGMTEYVLREGFSVLVNLEKGKELVKAGEIEMIGAESVEWLGVPLKTADRTVGVLAVQSYDPQITYTIEHQKILEFVSDQIANAIVRKQIETNLVKAKEIAEESSRLKSSLLSNISHEFRTPMTGILGFAEILATELKDPVYAGMAGNILGAANRLMNTLNVVIDLSMLESQSLEMKLRKVDVNALVKQTVSNYFSKSGEKGISLTEKTTAGTEVLGDENFLEVVLNQLVENAVKFTNQGTVAAETDLEELDHEKWVVIRVMDTGIGIPPEFQEVIFEKFRQVSEGYGRTYQGLGMGLPLCKKMVEFMGGHIRLESTPGVGSVFSVYLIPASRSEALLQVPGTIPETELRGADREQSVPQQIFNLLLVEDNQINIDLVLVYLKNRYKIEYVREASEAIRKCKEKSFDLILMDINLGPGIDGLQAAREIRKIKGYGEIPIVALTGYASPADEISLLAGGCSHYLAKPFNRKALADIIATALAG